MKNIILFGLLILAIVYYSDAKSLRNSPRGKFRANQNNAQLQEEFDALPTETQQQIKKALKMQRSGKLPNENSDTKSYNTHRKSPYQSRDEDFYGGSKQQQPQQMMPGPDPFYAMRGMQMMDNTKLNKIFDRWDEEAEEKKAQEQAEGESGGGDGGGMGDMSQVLGLAVKFLPLLMG